MSKAKEINALTTPPVCVVLNVEKKNSKSVSKGMKNAKVEEMRMFHCPKFNIN